MMVCWCDGAGANIVLRAPYFQGLGDLPGGEFYSFAHAVSADGTTVVGHSYQGFGEEEAFRWTAAGGMQGLGHLAGGLARRSDAYGVSADGSVIVGESTSTGAPTLAEAFRWTSTDGLQPLGFLPGGIGYSRAQGVSANGETVAGWSYSGSGTGLLPTEAFRWTSAAGIQGLGDLRGGVFNSYASGVSGDGSTVVGMGSIIEGRAVRWTAAGLQSLGVLPGGTRSFATAASYDGSVIVGDGDFSDRTEAFRWTSAGGMQGLGVPPGGIVSRAAAVNGDGSVIVGHTATLAGGDAMIWDQRRGMRSIAAILSASAALPTGWTLLSATGVSADGRTIVGYGVNPAGETEAWIAVIPEPSSLAMAALALAPLRRRRTAAGGWRDRGMTFANRATPGDAARTAWRSG